MMVDDATDFAGMLFAYPGKIGDFPAALKLGTTGPEMAFELFDPQGATRGELKVVGGEAPAWKFSAAATPRP